MGREQVYLLAHVWAFARELPAIRDGATEDLRPRMRIQW
jgi:hypothetical protein